MNVDLKALHQQHDPGDMLGKVTAFPEQMARAWEIGGEFASGLAAGDYRHVIVCGMGGSAIGGDMIRSFFGSRLRAPLVSCRDYVAPGYVGEGSLVIISSYSGNTGETLSAFDAIRGTGATVVAVTSGGQVEERCQTDGLPACKIPGGMPPRSAIGFSFLPMVQIMRAMGAADFDDAEYDEAHAAVSERCVTNAIESGDNTAADLAQALHGKLPLIYAGPGLFEAISRRWACQFNENSKVLAHFAPFPELNHNEIVGWEVLEEINKRIVVLSLEDGDDHAMTRRQTEVSLGIIEPLADKVIRFDGGPGGRLARMLSTMILGDFASVYLALLNGVDPTPVKKIDYLKSQLK